MPDIDLRSTIIWVAGVDWDAVPGTDKRLVGEIARTRPVVWVDPPRRGSWRSWLRGEPPTVMELGTITRVRVPATIGMTRFPVRWLTSILQYITVNRAMRSVNVDAFVVANPIATLPRSGVKKILYITDDWPAGAGLMRLNRAWLASTLARNARRADAVAAVSLPLLNLVAKDVGENTPSIVLPNGAPPLATSAGRHRLPIALLVGQVNERLDLALLEAIVMEGIQLRIVGPNAIRDSGAMARFDRLVASPLVDWVGPVQSQSVPFHLAEAGVGLTPYTPSPFNMASSPLKTLEYLAAGLPVVSSDLPASRWLDTSHVRVCPDTASFVAAVKMALEVRGDASAEQSRRAFAAKHSWTERAASMLSLIDSLYPA